MSALRRTEIEGCFEIFSEVSKDHRGRFVKFFRKQIYDENKLSTVFVEEYYSESCAGVIRGLHFQTPPHAHDKVVGCITGEVLDVTVDLRRESPTYLKVQALTLSNSLANFLYVPSGVAHGFCVLSHSALMLYKTTSAYSPAYDSGILWSSIPFLWPVSNPIVSKRDAEFVRLQDFQTPFI